MSDEEKIETENVAYKLSKTTVERKVLESLILGFRVARGEDVYADIAKLMGAK